VLIGFILNRKNDEYEEMAWQDVDPNGRRVSFVRHGREHWSTQMVFQSQKAKDAFHNSGLECWLHSLGTRNRPNHWQGTTDGHPQHPYLKPLRA